MANNADLVLILGKKQIIREALIESELPSSVAESDNSVIINSKFYPRNIFEG